MSKLTRSALVLTAALSLAMASASFANPPPHGTGPGARDGRPAQHQSSRPQTPQRSQPQQHRGQPQHHNAHPQQHKSQPAPRRDDHRSSHRHSTRNAVVAGVAAGAILFGIAELARSSQQSSGSAYYQQQAPATLYQSQGSQVVRYAYWCEEPQGYYPNVRSCPTGWRQVPSN